MTARPGSFIQGKAIANAPESESSGETVARIESLSDFCELWKTLRSDRSFLDHVPARGGGVSISVSLVSS